MFLLMLWLAYFQIFLQILHVCVLNINIFDSSFPFTEISFARHSYIYKLYKEKTIVFYHAILYDGFRFIDSQGYMN